MSKILSKEDQAREEQWRKNCEPLASIKQLLPQYEELFAAWNEQQPVLKAANKEIYDFFGFSTESFNRTLAAALENGRIPRASIPAARALEDKRLAILDQSTAIERQLTPVREALKAETDSIIRQLTIVLAGHEKRMIEQLTEILLPWANGESDAREIATGMHTIKELSRTTARYLSYVKPETKARAVIKDFEAWARVF
ncbi:MAG: hypothetical protein JWQ71_3736 [Pedosphaera sp.]|nr:hypothetical protein [Pedosphaera sp.]